MGSRRPLWETSFWRPPSLVLNNNAYNAIQDHMSGKVSLSESVPSWAGLLPSLLFLSALKAVSFRSLSQKHKHNPISTVSKLVRCIYRAPFETRDTRWWTMTAVKNMKWYRTLKIEVRDREWPVSWRSQEKQEWFFPPALDRIIHIWCCWYWF